MTSLDSIEMIIEWNQLGEKLRSGEFPDACHLVRDYLDTGEELAERGNKRNKHWIYSRMLKQLEDTICDPLVARHWRDCCADNLYRPIHMLTRIAETPREKAAAKHASQLAYRQCQYFLCSPVG